MKLNLKSLFALFVMIPIASVAVLGCGGSSETSIPDEAANVEAPTDNPDEEPDMGDGP